MLKLALCTAVLRPGHPSLGKDRHRQQRRNFVVQRDHHCRTTRGRVGLLLGVECDHSAGVAALSGGPVLGPLVAKHPGLAVPGAWNPFEAGVSAILSGQPDRDSLLEAFVARLGTPVPGLQEGLTYTFPDPARVTSASLAPIGLGQAEASAIAVLTAGREIPEVSDHIAFRLGQRDAFPSGDPSLQAALAHLGLRAPAANWRPWLALAAAHLMAYGDTLARTRCWYDAPTRARSEVLIGLSI